MSKIGSNIRKIRSVKALSQSDFAQLFKLTRASIGSYEEGRAEPKIDAAIEIAKYFNIPLGDIFTKDLTVNQLTNFVLSENLDLGTTIENTENHREIGFVSSEQFNYSKGQFTNNLSTKNWNKINFPSAPAACDVFLELKGLVIPGFRDQNIHAILGESVELPTKNRLILTISDKKILYGIFMGDNKIRLPDTGEEIVLEKSVYFFNVMLILTTPASLLSSFQERLETLENRIVELERIN